MNKILIPFLLAISVCVNAQQGESVPAADTSAMQFIKQPDSTGFGTADGKLISKEIDIAGGTIVSEDGRIELIFPAGALTANTTISIQPTTNLAPNGVGKSYSFEPSGTHFKKPVQIIFHYSDEEAEICPPDLMGLAMQDHKGKWSPINYDDWDSAGKTLKGFIQHFSGASNVYMLRLKPAKRQIRVKETTKIEVLEYNPGFNISVEAFFRIGQQNHWYVNGKELGSASLGYVMINEESSKATRTMSTHATYIAPEFLLQNGNPVTVSMNVKILSGKRKGQSRTLRCMIKVYDVYQVTVSHKAEFPGANGAEVADSSTFFVWVYPERIVIDNIKNHPPYLSKVPKKAQCSIIIFTEGYNGYVHLKDGYRNYKLSNDDPPEVFFQFLPMFETGILQFQWICPKISVSPLQTAYGIPISPEINFIANGQTQRINVNRYGVEYKTVIVPHRPSIF